jgi:hypothetical protein
MSPSKFQVSNTSRDDFFSFQTDIVSLLNVSNKVYCLREDSTGDKASILLRKALQFSVTLI